MSKSIVRSNRWTLQPNISNIVGSRNACGTSLFFGLTCCASGTTHTVKVAVVIPSDNRGFQMNALDAKRARAYLTGMGIYPSQLGIESMSAPGERELTEALLRRTVAMLSDGDLFCLYLLAGILTDGQSEGVTMGIDHPAQTVALEMAVGAL